MKLGIILILTFCVSCNNKRASATSQIQTNLDVATEAKDGLNTVKLFKRDAFQSYLKTKIINYLRKNILQDDVATMDQDTLIALKGALQDVTLFADALLQHHPSSGSRAVPEPEAVVVTPSTAVDFKNLSLAQAITMGNLEAVRYRVSFGDSLTTRRRNGHTPIHIASAYGQLAILQYFVEEARVPVETKNVYRFSPLHMAAYYGQMDAMRYLIAKGANVTGESSSRSVLHHAALSRKLEAVKYLVDIGADVNAKDSRGNSVLHMAALTSHLPIVQFLVQNGADTNAKNNFGLTPLHSTCQRKERKDGDGADVLKYLVEKGADLKATTKAGKTPLHYAAYTNRLRSLKFLIENGADVNAKDDNYDTPLHYMATNYLTYSEGAIKYLVEHGADIGARNNDAETPWLMAYFATSSEKFLADPALGF